MATPVRGQPTPAAPQAQSISAEPQFIPAPIVNVNDTWTYHHTGRNRTGWHDTHYTMTVQRVDESDIVVAINWPGSDLPPIVRMFPADWSFERSVNGQQTVINRPLAFPLSIGKSWKLEFTENHPNQFEVSRHDILPYKVTGWEDVTVPAGTFHALKIEAQCEWSAVIAPATSAVVGSRTDSSGAATVVQTRKAIQRTESGHEYKAFWYVPSVKRWVKISEEFYNANDVRTEYYADELESYKVGN